MASSTSIKHLQRNYRKGSGRESIFWRYPFFHWTMACWSKFQCWKTNMFFFYHDWFTCFFLCTLIFSQSQGTSHNSTILLHKPNWQLDGIMLGNHFLRQLFRTQRSVWCVKVPVVVNGMKPSLLGVYVYTDYFSPYHLFSKHFTLRPKQTNIYQDCC